MGLRQRLREARIEWAFDDLDDAKAELARAHRFQDGFGGYRGDIRRCERRVARIERRLDRLGATDG